MGLIQYSVSILFSKNVNIIDSDATTINTCRSILSSGKWKNFKKHNFLENWPSIYVENYPFNKNGRLFNFTNNQSYTGEWVGTYQEKECKLKTLNHSELKTCFGGNTRMIFFGDSRQCWCVIVVSYALCVIIHIMFRNFHKNNAK